MNKKYDCLCVGDVVTDAFIKLMNDQAYIANDPSGKKVLAIEYGSKLPFESTTVVKGVGNSPNAAVSMTRQGLSVGLVSDIGEDENGDSIRKALIDNKISIDFLRLHHGKTSNYHHVLWYGTDRTILVKHEDYDYEWPEISKTSIPKWVYYSSIGENYGNYYTEFIDWLERNPDVKLAFQPGSFQIMHFEAVKPLYQHAEFVIMNREEASAITGKPVEDVGGSADWFLELGVKLIVITDGPNGSYAKGPTYQLDKLQYMPIYPDISPPLERTGAGDSYASTIVTNLIKGRTVEEALRYGGVNSASVVTKIGAQAGLLPTSELDALLLKAPEDYKFRDA